MKKQIFGILGAIVLIGGLVAIGFVTGNDSSPSPTPSPTSGQGGSGVTSLSESQQFTEGNQVDTTITFNELGNTPTVYTPLAVYTANKYFENAIANPYFVSGYWQTKDNYSVNAINKYLTPYLSEDLKTEYLSQLTTPEFETFYSPLVFLPDSNLERLTECSEDWVEDACFSVTPPPSIDSIIVTGVDETHVKLDLTISISPQYLDPGNNGGTVLQPRQYNISMVLVEQNPATDDSELPIMIIETISGSLDIKDNQPYIGNNAP